VTVISLTSDIGHKDYLVGAVKGLLWQQNQSVQIADISHDIAPFNYNEAAYFIRNAYPHFPQHTWHIILVNLFDNAQPRCLLAKHQNMFFASPDNGLLPMVFDEVPEQTIVLPLTPQQIPNMLEWTKAIGHAIQAAAQGAKLEELGSPAEKIVVKTNLRPNIGADHIDGRIIYIDRFENVIVNITRQEFETARKGRNFYIGFKTDDVIHRLSDHYGQVNEGDKLAFFNTAGYLEIAVNKGNAAGLFGLQATQRNESGASQQFMQARMFYQTVRIFFEDQ